MKQITTQIGNALDYAHAQGVVHRDIKPKNILLDRRDNALLTDFGIAKDLEDDPRITRMGHTVGTPTYMSPEQIQGQPLDGRSDIYSLGVVLYQLATGYLPFQGQTREEVCAQHLNEPVPLPRAKNPELPAALEQIILKMLAKKTTGRYATASQMVQAIEAITRPPVLSGPTGGVDNQSTRLSQLSPPSPVINRPPAEADPESGKATAISSWPRTRTRSANPPGSKPDEGETSAGPGPRPESNISQPDEGDDDKTVLLSAPQIDKELMPGRGRPFTIFLAFVMIVLAIIAALMGFYIVFEAG
jgi:serine/threonine protein kinase